MTCARVCRASRPPSSATAERGSPIRLRRQPPWRLPSQRRARWYVRSIRPKRLVQSRLSRLARLGGQLTEWFRQRIAEPGILPAFLYFTRVAECSTRRKRTSWSSLPKWLRPFDPNGFHRHPSDQPPVRLHSELLQPFCKVSQPVLWLRTPRHCLRDTQPTTKPGLSLE